MRKKIATLIERSKSVINDCSLENGAIVAANSDMKIYPKDVQNYRYVWPRDASFALVAADILDVKGIHENFFEWIMDRAEGFNDTGLLYQNYYTNGPKRWLSFQPDQNGSLLWSINHHIKKNKKNLKKYKSLIEKLADGICSVWNGNHFTIISQDLWEENYTYPQNRTNHTYSLAACAHGLELAHSYIKKENYIKTSTEMKVQINKSYNGYFYRTSGNLADSRIDISILGLVYPFKIFSPVDEKIIKTLKILYQRLVKNNCVFRCENDSYDSFRYNGIDGRRGSGFWPVSNFWLSIYYSINKQRKEALNYYLQVIDSISDYIPEQIFQNDIQKSPCPLVWSHAKFIICSKYLGFI